MNIEFETVNPNGVIKVWRGVDIVGQLIHFKEIQLGDKYYLDGVWFTVRSIWSDICNFIEVESSRNEIVLFVIRDLSCAT